MAILNYTTGVPVDKTIAEIQKALAKAKANGILTEYDGNGEACALSFRISLGDNSMFFKLPVDVDGVSNAMKKDRVYKDDAHARRVAWRIVKDWVQAQMALVEAQMADTQQVFLPYAATDTGETVYQKFQKSGFLQLTKQEQS